MKWSNRIREIAAGVDLRRTVRTLFCAGLLGGSAACFAIGQHKIVTFLPGKGSFTIVDSNRVSSVYCDQTDFPGVNIAAKDLIGDIAKVSGKTPAFSQSIAGSGQSLIIVGTIGKSPVINALISTKQIDVSKIKGKWEAFSIQVVANPFPGIRQALVVVGADKRGSIYGVYELSEQMGVSPWYWWADVPVAHHSALYVSHEKFVQGPPAVKYRGIFLNDEAPALSNWVYQNFTEYRHAFYVHVFELLLRLRANYLWPAMWNNCFSQDDPLNPKLADEYGIVMGTSHVEPMMRADKEWNRQGFTANDWNYLTHPKELEKFWVDGIVRNKPYENIVTIAMRGKVDTPMSESANISLLEKIVAAQRKLIAEKINPDVTKVPQLWALYKEVQEYYEKGMRVPDDVTLLWCDDNWGNIRRLPTTEERKRTGGAGVYYHFDYVGGPRNYKWINTNPIPKIWQQMTLAKTMGADKIWIVNVGDLKPMEFPMEFFLSLARDPSRWGKDSLTDYTRQWATREFGPMYAAEIADIVDLTTKYNGRRKPELIDPSTYSITDYHEADRICNEFDSLVMRAELIAKKLPDSYQDAFFQLVTHPAKAAGILNKLYVTVAKNRLYARQSRASTNDYADQARALFKADADLTKYFHTKVSNGKWNHFMDQTHIGYTTWQQPDQNNMPRLQQTTVPVPAKMGISPEGSPMVWPQETQPASLPVFDSFNKGTHYVDVFNQGASAFKFTAIPSVPWITVSRSSGTVIKDSRVWVSIDWSRVPLEAGAGTVKFNQVGGQSVEVAVTALRPSLPLLSNLNGFVEANGYVSIEPGNYTKKVDKPGAQWGVIPSYGNTSSGVSIFPIDASSRTPAKDAPSVEYNMYLFSSGTVRVDATLGTALDYTPGVKRRIAFSFDGAPPQVVPVSPIYLSRDWEKEVSDNSRKISSTHTIAKPGYHTLKVWMVDSGLVVQKLLVDFGGAKPCYLGPPESFHRIVKSTAR